MVVCFALPDGPAVHFMMRSDSEVRFIKWLFASSSPAARPSAL